MVFQPFKPQCKQHPQYVGTPYRQNRNLPSVVWFQQQHWTTNIKSRHALVCTNSLYRQQQYQSQSHIELPLCCYCYCCYQIYFEHSVWVSFVVVMLAKGVHVESSGMVPQKSSSSKRRHQQHSVVPNTHVRHCKKTEHFEKLVVIF